MSESDGMLERALEFTPGCGGIPARAEFHERLAAEFRAVIREARRHMLLVVLRARSTEDAAEEIRAMIKWEGK